MSAETVDTLLVLHKNDHSLGYYDPVDGHEISRIPLAPYPHEFAFSPDGRYVYCCHFGVALAEDEGPGGDSVSIVDLARKALVGRISCLPYRRPHGIDVDGAGNIWVSSEGASMLLRFSPDDIEATQARPTGGKGSHIVTVNRKGTQAWVSNMGSNTVSLIAEDESALTLDVGERPEGSVLGRDEAWLYVSNRESDSISVIDTRAGRLDHSIETAPGPVRLATDRNGRLLAALYHAKALAVIDPGHSDRQQIIKLPAKPVSIGYDERNHRAMLSTLDDEVCFIDLREGTVTQRIATHAGPDPCAMIRI